ncbi:hypothetical protein BYT27DRAFT_6875948 [Phlegmacium glaucopus]|nr:hypothetical protein BYT27DRAFT_6875948 [Phlegmacium glaucopus]
MFRTVTTRTPSKNKIQHVVRHSRYNSTHQYEKRKLKHQLRILLRDVAQPVAVVTSLLTSNGPAKHIFHGATLSSFTSIAMDPYPLITFALRIPSRMAASLDAFAAASLQDPSTPSHMVVNLLSAQQASIAVKFSRPDLHPQPFESVAYRLTQEGIPMLDGSLGALSCKLVSRAIPLHDLDFLRNGVVTRPVSLRKEDVASELFIARVLRIEAGDERTLPLIYHQRSYTTCKEQ